MKTVGRRFTFRNKRERGAAAMELALLVPIFVLMVSGIVELGHAWYLHHAITNASREGARLGMRYRSLNNARVVIPESEIQTAVRQYLAEFFNNDDYLTDSSIIVTAPPPNPYTAGADRTVTVSMPKEWFILGPLIGLGDVTITASTTMKLE